MVYRSVLRFIKVVSAVRVLLTIFLFSAIYFSVNAFEPSGQEGEALWLAESRGVLSVVPESGIAKFEIPIKTGARAVAVDSTRETVWTLSQHALHAHSLSGASLFKTEVSGRQGEPEVLQVEPASGVVWLAMHSQISAYDSTGQSLLSRNLNKPFSAATLDPQKRIFWVAVDDTLEAIDDSGSLIAAKRLEKVKKIRALTYAPESEYLWVVADDALLQVSGDDNTVNEIFRNKIFNQFNTIKADGHGGLWAVDQRQLYAIDKHGAVINHGRPFRDESPDLIEDVFSNPVDGTAWVASQRSVVHFDRYDGVLSVITPDPGDKKTRLIEGLFLETAGRPQVEFVSPINGALLNSRFPKLNISYRGADLDLGSIAFVANGAVISTTCSTEPDKAECVPDNPLADDVYDLVVTIANTSGEISEPAELKITIDATAPVISVTSPENNFLTNNAVLQITGEVSEPVSLVINGNPVETQNNQFTYGSVTLQEGANTLGLSAKDPAGNVGSLMLSGVLDTIPPQIPAHELIQMQVSGDQIIISGQAGSVEANSRVAIVNLRTGEQVIVTANSNGSFNAGLPGGVGDEIQIQSTDPATNQSESITVQVVGTGPFSGPINIANISPGDGSTVDGDFVLVNLDLEAPPNTGVTVNDIVAVSVPSQAGLRFYAVVPLQTGQNDLSIQIHALDGRIVNRTLNVTSTGPFPYLIQASQLAGVAPIEVEFGVLDQLGKGIQQVQVDFDSDGTIDSITDGYDPITTEYTGNGIKQARFYVFDTTGKLHTQIKAIVLLNSAVVDQSIQAIWSAMNDALIAGDKDKALTYLSVGAKEQFDEVFEVLIPKMPEIVASYSPLRQSLVTGEYVEYGVNRLIDGVDRVFLIGFVMNEFGQWQVDSM